MNSPAPAAAHLPVLLFGAPVGLYTGKIRSYFRKQGIAYLERLPSDPVFQKELLPQLKRFINPVIRTAAGTVVQDTADIIDFCEAAGLARAPATPATPVQRIVALTLDLFGGEGLVRPAMHYRWSFRAQNENFLRHEFGLSYRPSRQPPEVVEKRLGDFMNYLAAYIPKFGITQDTIPAIEASYEAFLAALDAHLRQHPYLLGGVPTLCDYGFMAPLYAHLARDPVPCEIMKRIAPSVFRWTERMNANDADVPEFPRYPAALAADDSVPDTLLPVLRFIASDWLPELEADIAAIDQWLASRGDSALEGKPIERTLCETNFELRGTRLTTIVQPYTLYKLQRVTDAWDALNAAERERERAGAVLAKAGLEKLPALKGARRVERRDFLEVWGRATS